MFCLIVCSIVCLVVESLEDLEAIKYTPPTTDHPVGDVTVPLPAPAAPTPAEKPADAAPAPPAGLGPSPRKIARDSRLLRSANVAHNKRQTNEQTLKQTKKQTSKCVAGSKERSSDHGDPPATLHPRAPHTRPAGSRYPARDGALKDTILQLGGGQPPLQLTIRHAVRQHHLGHGQQGASEVQNTASKWVREHEVCTCTHIFENEGDGVDCAVVVVLVLVCLPRHVEDHARCALEEEQRPAKMQVVAGRHVSAATELVNSCAQKVRDARCSSHAAQLSSRANTDTHAEMIRDNRDNTKPT